jgi:hypothetical protein
VVTDQAWGDNQVFPIDNHESFACVIKWRSPLHKVNADQISRNMQPFFLKMAHNYQVEIELPAPTKKPTKWELKLSEEGRGRFGKAELNYPRQLAACQP